MCGKMGLFDILSERAKKGYFGEGELWKASMCSRLRYSRFERCWKAPECGKQREEHLSLTICKELPTACHEGA